MENSNLNDLIIVKRTGQRVSFNGTKIALAIKKAFDSVNQETDPKDVNKIYEKVLKNIEQNYKDRKTINVEDIQDIIETVLNQSNYTEVYQAFSEYRLKRAASREVFEVKQQHKFVKAMERLILSAKKDTKQNPLETLTSFGKIISSEFAVFSNSAVSLSAASGLTCAKNAAWETSIRVACSDTMIRYLL